MSLWNLQTWLLKIKIRLWPWSINWNQEEVPIFIQRLNKQFILCKIGRMLRGIRRLCSLRMEKVWSSMYLKAEMLRRWESWKLVQSLRVKLTLMGSGCTKICKAKTLLVLPKFLGQWMATSPIAPTSVPLSSILSPTCWHVQPSMSN